MTGRKKMPFMIFLSSLAILSLHCTPIRRNSPDTLLSCCGTSCSSQVTVDIEGKTLFFLGLSAKDQLINALHSSAKNLRCEQTSDGKSKECTRYIEFTINDFSFISEGEDACMGAGEGVFSYQAPRICTSLEEGVTQVLKEFATHLDTYTCDAKDKGKDCGFEITGSGKIIIYVAPSKYQAPTSCTIHSVEIQFKKEYRTTNVEGFWDEYKISLEGSIQETCLGPLIAKNKTVFGQP